MIESINRQPCDSSSSINYSKIQEQEQQRRFYLQNQAVSKQQELRQRENFILNKINSGEYYGDERSKLLSQYFEVQKLKYN
jgi:hypothetical protein